MILIRVVEEKIGDMVGQGVVKCPCHLAIGSARCWCGRLRSEG
jgi:TPP-dependent pyruvate/acetoin dehydrogenase alpha subunit